MKKVIKMLDTAPSSQMMDDGETANDVGAALRTEKKAKSLTCARLCALAGHARD